MTPIRISKNLGAAVDKLHFAPPTTHVYNPLAYARPSHEQYLKRFCAKPCEVVFLGMNPGPFGMAQTGVPFGDIAMVRDWMGIEGAVGKPPLEHPKRLVEGFACARSEVSGTRFWGWARNRFGAPEPFFARFFVWNYCPLSFMEETGRNRTPDKLPAAEREPLFAACDAALAALVKHLQPRAVIGVGKFAETRAREALPGTGVAFGSIPHPSPANPAANKGWAKAAEAALAQLKIDL